MRVADCLGSVGNGLLAVLQGLGLIDTGLDVLDLGFQDIALPLEVLLAAELNSQPGGIDHSTLGLLLAEGGLSGCLVVDRVPISDSIFILEAWMAWF